VILEIKLPTTSWYPQHRNLPRADLFPSRGVGHNDRAESDERYYCYGGTGFYLLPQIISGVVENSAITTARNSCDGVNNHNDAATEKYYHSELLMGPNLCFQSSKPGIIRAFNRFEHCEGLRLGKREPKSVHR